jgi:hypothetical protein
MQRGIIEALSEVARSLDRNGRLGLMTDLLILSRCAADDSIRERVLGLLAVLRSSPETRT